MTKLLKNTIYEQFKEIKIYIDSLINDFSYENISKEICAIDRIQVNNIWIVLLDLNIPNIRKNSKY